MNENKTSSSTLAHVMFRPHPVTDFTFPVAFPAPAIIVIAGRSKAIIGLNRFQIAILSYCFLSL